jgi:hypothetical protein
MAEHPDRPDTPEYDETVSPTNPPYAVTNRDVRRGAWWLYVFPLIVVCIVAGIVLLYWLTNDRSPNDQPAVGTSGEQMEQRREGGGDPQPGPDSTADELDRRGGNPNR